MKKFIRWLADVSGVTKEIEIENTKSIGCHMKQYSYWFSGGLMHGDALKDVANVLSLYPEECLKHGNPNLCGSQHLNLREKLYKMNTNDESVFDDEPKK
jgi:hypothetical protein